MTTDRRRRIIGFWVPTLGLFALSLAIYGWQASGTALLDRAMAERDSYLTTLATTRLADPAVEEAAAQAYWQRYPDVAADRYYGREGPLGFFGARQHFHDHGQREGRQWGP